MGHLMVVAAAPAGHHHQHHHPLQEEEEEEVVVVADEGKGEVAEMMEQRSYPHHLYQQRVNQFKADVLFVAIHRILQMPAQIEANRNFVFCVIVIASSNQSPFCTWWGLCRCIIMYFRVILAEWLDNA